MTTPETILSALSDDGELPGRYPPSVERLEPSFHSFLLLVGTTLSTALNQANANVTNGVVCGTFHLDFVDSSSPDAFAFQHEGYAFIIISIPMAELLLQLAATLSRAQSIADLLAIDPTRHGMSDALRTALFFVEVSFLVCHEFTHHVHEHLPAAFGKGLAISKEFGGVTPGGTRLEDQAQEADADAYAVYIALNHLIAEGGRVFAGSLFTEHGKSDGRVDEALFTLFVIAVGAIFYALAPVVFDETKVYTRQHPPEALRMNYEMHSAKSWCNQNRPLVERWISLEIFQIAMAGVAEAIFGPAGRTNLLHQNRFLLSDAGTAYVSKLEEVRLRQFADWKQRSEAQMPPLSHHPPETQRIRRRRSTSGAGVSFAASSLARMKVSIGLCGQFFAFTAGSAGRTGGWKDQCSFHRAHGRDKRNAKR